MAVFALLCGVLVIAFPVSIFSELWSEELKKLHDLKNDYRGYEDDLSYQSGNSSQSGNSREAPVKFVSTGSMRDFVSHELERSKTRETTSFERRIQQSALNDSSHGSLAHTGHTGHTDHSGFNNQDNLNHKDLSAPVVELTTKDVADLRRYMESIERTQQKIRTILAKLE